MLERVIKEMDGHGETPTTVFTPTAAASAADTLAAAATSSSGTGSPLVRRPTSTRSKNKASAGEVGLRGVVRWKRVA